MRVLYYTQYMIISFALAKHRLRVSQTVLLCPLDIAYLCLFYPAIIGCTSILNSYEYSHFGLCSFLPSKRRRRVFRKLSNTEHRRWCVCCFLFNPAKIQHAPFNFPALYLRRPSINMTTQMYSLYYRIVRSEYENKCEETN